MWNEMSVSRRGLDSKVADFMGLVNFEWYNQNKVGTIGIIVLRRVCEKLVIWNFHTQSETDQYALKLMKDQEPFATEEWENRTVQ